MSGSQNGRRVAAPQAVSGDSGFDAMASALDRHSPQPIQIPMKKSAVFLVVAGVLLPLTRAELKLPALISDHMVLQQKQANPIWGWDAPGTKVTVTFAGQTETA